MNKKYTIILSVSIIIISGLIFIYYPKLNIEEPSFSRNFVYIKKQADFSSSEFKTQIDETIGHERVNKIFISINPLHSSYTVLFNTYKVDGKDRTRFAQVNVSRESIFNFEWTADKTYTGYIYKPFSEAVDIAQKYDLSKENPDPQNITVFAPLKPSSSSETVVYPQGVTVPNQGGVETK